MWAWVRGFVGWGIGQRHVCSCGTKEIVLEENVFYRSVARECNVFYRSVVERHRCLSMFVAVAVVSFSGTIV